MRHDGRAADEQRPIKIRRRYTKSAPGSVLIHCGKTSVLCTASVDEQVPPWMAGQGRGWVTAEYSMLPGSTNPRKRRERGKIDGRSNEIQRLIGRSLRAVTDLDALGERAITVDCDVLDADGGTRTASITAAFVALVDAMRSIPEFRRAKKLPLRAAVAAVSTGIVDGRALLDLDYVEDSAAEVDMNVVMTSRNQYVEVQGTGEESTFTDGELEKMLKLARSGIRRLNEIQQKALGKSWPL